MNNVMSSYFFYRETELESKCIIHMEDKKTTIENKVSL